MRKAIKVYVNKTHEIQTVEIALSNTRRVYQVEDNQSTDLSNVYFISGSKAIEVFDDETNKDNNKENKDDVKA